MKIAVRNPYYEKEYDVVETLDDVVNFITNIRHGNEDFIVCHTIDGLLLTISPSNFASVEFKEAEIAQDMQESDKG